MSFAKDKKPPLLLLALIAINDFGFGTEIHLAHFTAFHIKGRLYSQSASCIVAKCHGLLEVSCIARNYNQTTILASYNGSHAISCFIRGDPAAIDFRHFPGHWFYNNSKYILRLKKKG